MQQILNLLPAIIAVKLATSHHNAPSLSITRLIKHRLAAKEGNARAKVVAGITKMVQTKQGGSINKLMFHNHNLKRSFMAVVLGL
jgi:hypothetical protein